MRLVSTAVGLILVTLAPATALGADDNILGLPDRAILAQGSLVIGGGGRTAEQTRAEFVRLAGGPRARIVLIPSACTYESLEFIKQYFSGWEEYHIASLEFLDAKNRQQADTYDFIRPLLSATGVWMPGGSQGRLADLYGGTKVELAIRQVFERGGVVGGTSAGAAILSQLMILEGTTCSASTSRGFGLLDKVVVDQHFSQRGRHARLLSVLEEHPGLLGIGVDEGTALVVQGNHLHVLGESHVTVCIPTDASRATLVYRLMPGEQVDLTMPAAAPDVPIRVALRKSPW
jgi:cyanophycinase